MKPGSAQLLAGAPLRPGGPGLLGYVDARPLHGDQETPGRQRPERDRQLAAGGPQLVRLAGRVVAGQPGPGEDRVEPGVRLRVEPQPGEVAEGAVDVVERRVAALVATPRLARRP